MNKGQNQVTIEGVLLPEDTKTFHRVQIPIDEQTSCLRLFFEYGPREELDTAAGEQIARDKLGEYRELLGRLGSEVQQELDKRVESIVKSILPLRNLLNFSLYDPQGQFRGRWDSPQYFGKWVEIGPLERTGRGFIPGPLGTGVWTVEIEVHAVVTKSCNYVLSYELEKATNPKAEWGWYRGELHLHTNHSDGKVSLGDQVSAAKQRGLDFFVLTDHNTVSAHGLIAEENFPIISGMELTTFYGHAVAMGIDSYVDWRHPQNHDFREQIDLIHSQGGLFSIAHPFTIGDPICTGCQWLYHNVDLNNVDLVEIWSGSWRKEWAANSLALAWWDDLLNQGLRIGGIAARDVHDPKQFSLADAADTYVWAESSSPVHILEGLRKGRVFVSSGPRVYLSVKTETGEFFPGESVSRLKNRDFLLSVTVQDLVEPAILKVVRRGYVLEEVSLSKSDRWEYALEAGAGNNDWVRVELWAEGASGPGRSLLLALTNPIFLD